MHDRIAINHLCFMADPMPVFGEHVRALGARQISLLGPLIISDDGAAAARALVKSGNYGVATITQPFQMGQHISANEDDWILPRANLSRVIEVAAEVNARSIYMVTGGHGSLDWDEAARCFAAAIAPCVAQAQALDVQLMIETTNPFFADIHLAHSLADTIKLAEIAGIGVCIDLFACWTESDLRNLIKRAVPSCRAVQFSDYAYGDRTIPERAVPGDGAIPLERLTGWILEAGYQGAFDMELGGPRIAAEGEFAAVRRSADYMSELLTRLGA